MISIIKKQQHDLKRDLLKEKTAKAYLDIINSTIDKNPEKCESSVCSIEHLHIEPTNMKQFISNTLKKLGYDMKPVYKSGKIIKFSLISL